MSSAALPCTLPSPRVIEIERKVKWTQHTEKILTQLGFTDIESPLTIVDTYLDDANCTLSTNDIWLRRRDDAWELKRPLRIDKNRSMEAVEHAAAGFSRYEEQTNETQIVDSLQQLFNTAKPNKILQEMQIPLEERSKPVCQLELKAQLGDTPTPLISLIASRALFPICHFRTTRRTLRHSSVVHPATSNSTPSASEFAPFTVVLDEADYLREPANAAQEKIFRVAEVEIVLEAPTDTAMSEAEDRVNAFAKQLEDPVDAASLKGESVLPRGKLERFLALYRPWHFDLLTRCIQAIKAKRASTW